jgi:hypothetical protein
MRGADLLEQPGYSPVSGRPALATRLMSQRAGDPSLSRPGRSGHQEILSPFDPGAVGQRRDLRFVEAATAFVADVFDAGLRDFQARVAQ